MAKKKKKTPSGSSSSAEAESPALKASPVLSEPIKSKATNDTVTKREWTASKVKEYPELPNPPTLIICRNKHWRYISSYHGPWLSVPPDVLEAYAHNNFYSRHPRPIDPAVFYDLIKIRRLVDEASDLAVRAASGVASSAKSSQVNGDGLGNVVAALGLGYGGGNAKLSKERKNRMREMATQKMSKAYQIDEIATSVVTMQSASSLDEVGRLVLQRKINDSDAKYVHFFHEKIPSRMLAQCTSLQPLDEIILDRSMDGPPLRTRALTKLFKDDSYGAARDLTEALVMCRSHLSQHSAASGQLELVRKIQRETRPRDWRDLKLEEEDQPNSLEAQLLFHRAGVYLTLACQHIEGSLPPKAGTASSYSGDASDSFEEDELVARTRNEMGKIVRLNAKKAVKDYISFFSHLEYTPGLPSEDINKPTRNAIKNTNGAQNTSDAKQDNSETGNVMSPTTTSTSGALIAHKPLSTAFGKGPSISSSYCSAERDVYQISSLFSSTSIVTLPPLSSTPLTLRSIVQHSPIADSTNLFRANDQYEAITYHPLLVDALHSLLLAHSLLQTSTKEILRHAQMVARLTRVCDGYPLFHEARSPARQDWIEILRLTDNWIELSKSWEKLCAPAPQPGAEVVKKVSVFTYSKAGLERRKKEARKREAILDAVSDERVQDEESFQAAVEARIRRAELDDEVSEGNEQSAKDGEPVLPRKWAHDKTRESALIGSLRAHVIGRWILEAPPMAEGQRGRKKKPKKAKAGDQEVTNRMESLSLGEKGERFLEACE